MFQEVPTCFGDENITGVVRILMTFQDTIYNVASHIIYKRSRLELSIGVQADSSQCFGHSCDFSLIITQSPERGFENTSHEISATDKQSYSVKNLGSTSEPQDRLEQQRFTLFLPGLQVCYYICL